MDAPKNRGYDDVGWRKAGEVAVAIFKLDMDNLLRDHEVRKALDAVEKAAGHKDREIKDREIVVWAAVAVQKPRRRVDWKKLWASGTGKSWKALKEFPERIRKMAAELKTSLCDDVFGQKDARQFWDLPPSLCDYADWLESQIEKIPVMGNRAPRRGTSQWKGHLSDRVKALTGRFHDKEVAELLNAVDLALHGEGNGDRGIDAQTLADARSRHKKRKRKAPRT